MRKVGAFGSAISAGGRATTIDMSTHANAELLERFYTAFAARDAETMAACYAPNVRFSDPVFPNLEGAAAGDMWRMLTEPEGDLRVEHSGISADDTSGRAHWEAWYTFSLSGRKVHNIIDAEFTFEDGLIVRHQDRFDFGRWSRQALGTPAYLLGWTGLIQKKVRATAGGRLEKWRAKR